MNLHNLFNRSKDLLINPAEEFKRISEENFVVFTINKTFVIPLAILVSIFTIIGAAFSNISSSGNAFLFIGINALIVFFLVLTHTYISGKTISLVGQNIKRSEHASDYYALATYSQLPFFLILAIIKLFPSLVFLIFISLYSGLIFYSGTGTLTKIQPDKRVQFTLLSILIMIISFVVFSELYTILYSEVIDQFSTFAAL